MLKRIVSVLLAAILMSGSVYASVIPAEEYEHLTHTKVNPWIDHYHLTTQKNIENNYKGGENHQVMYSSAISDVNPDVMIVGTDTNGVHRSNDGGKLWTPMETHSFTGVCSLAFYPGSDKICFASAFGYYPKSGIYKSLDAGKTWEQKSSMAQHKNHHYGTIAFGPKIGEVTEDGLDVRPIYTSSGRWPQESYKGNPLYAGVFRSDDLGETFYSIGLCDYLIIDMWSDQESDLLVVGTQGTGVMVSRDGGGTWSCATEGLTYKEEKTDENGEKYTETIPVTEIASLTVNPANKKNWIVATQRKMFMTYDEGKTWEEMESDFGPGGLGSSGKIQRLRFTYPNKETGKNVLMLQISQCNRGTRISYDGGKTFETLYDHTDLTNETYEGWTQWYSGSVAITPAEPDLILTNWDQIVISRDHGQTFNTSSSGMSGALVHDFIFDDDGQLRLVGMLDMGVARRVDGYEGYFPPMEHVQKFPTMDGGAKSTNTIAVNPRDRNHVLAVTGSGSSYGNIGYLAETYDDFKTFGIYSDMRQRFLDIQAETGVKKNIREIIWREVNPDIVYADWFVSEDCAKTWRETNVRVLESSPFDADIAYAIDNKELVISYDRARTWRKTGFKFSGQVAAIVADLFEPFLVYVSIHGSSQIFKIDLKTGKMDLWSKDNGFYIIQENGEKYHPGIGFQMGELQQDPNNKDHMIVTGNDFYASLNYLFETYDGGSSWTQVKGLPGGCNIGCAEFNPVESDIYIGSSQGMYVYHFKKYGMQEDNQ